MAEDTVNDLFLRLLELGMKKRKTLFGRVRANLDQYLKVMVKNRCIDQLRTKSTRKRIEDSIFVQVNRSINEDLLVQKDFQLLLELLPEQQRRVFVMHLEGYDNNDIAQSLTLSYNTVRNTLSNSKKKLRLFWKDLM